MKRCLVLLLALLLAAPCALAEEYIGAAVTAVRASLYETPKRDAAELMRYYKGVRVEVVREVDSTYVQVNVGEPGVSLMGYMRKVDLAFGEAAIRQVWPDEVFCKGEETLICALYSYPNRRAEIVEQEVTPRFVLGTRGSEWLYVQTWSDIRGFVNLDDLYEYNMSMAFGSASYIDTEPMEGEFTWEEAIEIARKEMLECEDSSVYLGVVTYEGEQVDAQRLALCTPEVELVCKSTIPEDLMYSVNFREADRSIYAGLWFSAEGRKVRKIGHGVG